MSKIYWFWLAGALLGVPAVAMMFVPSWHRALCDSYIYLAAFYLGHLATSMYHQQSPRPSTRRDAVTIVWKGEKNGSEYAFEVMPGRMYRVGESDVLVGVRCDD